MSDKIKRCDPNDPHRCQATINNGTAQCANLASEGHKYCANHGGIDTRKEQVRNYNLARWHREIAEKANSPALKQLHEEVGLLRFLLEKIINQCNTENDLIMASGQISDLVGKVEKLVVSCNALDVKLGNSLDKNQLLKFATVVIDIISNNISDPEISGIIADEIVHALGDADTFSVE